jgi:predicted lipoprotein with Yx(FWY)xxD motif
LGSIVVDGKGMTAYFYDKDTANSGSSVCTGACASAWPAITTTSASPTVDGVTGTVGTITGVAGGKQITVNGMPIYTFASDTTPGDTKGQLFGGVWHVITPAGTEITTPNAG